jgi:hypothetical protein
LPVRSVSEFITYATNPPSSKAPDRPDFHCGLGFTRCLARKGREIAAGLPPAGTLPRSSNFGRRSWLRRIECALGGVNWTANARHPWRSRTKSSAKTNGARLGKQNEDVE